MGRVSERFLNELAAEVERYLPQIVKNNPQLAKVLIGSGICIKVRLVEVSNKIAGTKTSFEATEKPVEAPEPIKPYPRELTTLQVPAKLPREQKELKEFIQSAIKEADAKLPRISIKECIEGEYHSRSGSDRYGKYWVMRYEGNLGVRISGHKSMKLAKDRAKVERKKLEEEIANMTADPDGVKMALQGKRLLERGARLTPKPTGDDKEPPTKNLFGWSSDEY